MELDARLIPAFGDTVSWRVLVGRGGDVSVRWVDSVGAEPPRKPRHKPVDTVLVERIAGLLQTVGSLALAPGNLHRTDDFPWIDVRWNDSTGAGQLELPDIGDPCWDRISEPARGAARELLSVLEALAMARKPTDQVTPPR